MKKTNSIKKLEHIANLLRQAVIKMLAKAKSGHTAGALGMADVFAALYFNAASYDAKKPDWEKRDRIILSNGHICPVMYASMAFAGFFPMDELLTLRKINSRLQGHPHNLSLPGVETSSGPLGQGVSQAAGLALGLKMKKSSSFVYLLTSDGEHDEGQTWEAIMFAKKYSLNNLINIVDRNFIQISGSTEKVMPLGKLKEKYKAFGWHVIDINGNSMKEVVEAIKKAKQAAKSKNTPVCIIANTVPGKGVSFIENNYEWHGKPPTDVEAEEALRQLEDIRKRI
ncbi:transketolase [Candidatus Woesearchaeota archaeon]|nr:transketolase [Candidatus Woesearchaeota archaeon]